MRRGFRPDLPELRRRLVKFPYCAALTSLDDLELALASRTELIVILRGDGLQLASLVERVHGAGKVCAVHVDLVDGVAADHEGVRWLARCGADAIISSRGSVVRAVRAEGLLAVQRLLGHDRASIAGGRAAVERAHPDVVEFLPGILLPAVGDLLRPHDLGAPLLAGGFIRDHAGASAVLAAGALAVTTSSSQLWT